MKILVTGATGYIGGAAAKALLRSGHQVLGLARSGGSAARLRAAGIPSLPGDFLDKASLTKAVAAVDVVVSTASIAAVEATPGGFADDQAAVDVMLGAMRGTGKTLIFTSGSAVVGTFGRGEASETVFDESVALPLREDVVVPNGVEVPAMLVAGLGTAMAARIQTEKDVLGAAGIRGMVMRPGLVYGHGASYDIPGLIAMAKANGAAPHLGQGTLRQGYVHVDDLAELYRLAVEHGEAGATFHGVTDEVALGDLARAVSRLTGAGDRTDSFTLAQMFAAGGAIGISLSLNKRLSSEKTRRALGWKPTRTDLLEDVAHGSYATALAKGA
jgi:nucleoside-diphosphate-sugar epimerase